MLQFFRVVLHDILQSVFRRIYESTHPLPKDISQLTCQRSPAGTEGASCWRHFVKCPQNIREKEKPPTVSVTFNITAIYSGHARHLLLHRPAPRRECLLVSMLCCVECEELLLVHIKELIPVATRKIVPLAVGGPALSDSGFTPSQLRIVNSIILGCGVLMMVSSKQKGLPMKASPC
jgi:hypothetical protein